jgi:hypothetical protein
MRSYKIFNDSMTNTPSTIGTSDNWFFGINGADNMDYQRFKTDIIDGAELQDAKGNVMTPEQIEEFMKGLP